MTTRPPSALASGGDDRAGPAMHDTHAVERRSPIRSPRSQIAPAPDSYRVANDARRVLNRSPLLVRGRMLRLPRGRHCRHATCTASLSRVGTFSGNDTTRWRSRALATRARVSRRLRAPPPSSRREMTDCVVPTWVAASALGADLSSSVDLVSFVLVLLAEGGEHDDAPVLGEPAGDPPCCRAEREPQLEQPVAERAGQRHASYRPELSERVDDHHAAIPLVIVQPEQPTRDLVVQLDVGHISPSHTGDDRTNSISRG